MTEAAQNTVPTTPETPATPAGQPAPASKYEQARSMLLKPKEAPAPPPAAPQVAPAPKEEQPPGTDLQRAQAATLRLQREAIEAKQQAKQLAERAKVADILESKDPKAIRALLKTQLGVEYMESLAKAELESTDPEEDPRDREIRELREKWEAKEKADKEREEAEAAEAAYRKNMEIVSNALANNMAKHPLLQGMPGAAGHIYKRCQKFYEDNRGELSPDVEAIALAYHQELVSDLDQVLGPDAALDAWLMRPETKARISKKLGIKDSSAGPASDEGANGKRDDAQPANSSTAAAGVAPRQVRDPGDKYAAALEDLKRRTGRK